MKELSIEQKAQRYDEAIEIAREINNEQQAQPFNVMTRVFPELKESKDEKIRKVIYGWIYTQPSQFFDSGFSKEEMLAWLERQGECEFDCHQNHQDVNRPNGCIVLEDFNGGEGFYKMHLDYLNKKQVEEVEEMIRVWNKELKTPNENIKDCIGMCLTDADEQRFKDYNTNLKECLAWLKKQGGRNLPIEKLPFEMKTVSESLGFTTQKECDDYNKMVTDLIMSDDDNGKQKPAWSEEDEAHIMAIDLAVNRCLGKWHCCGEKCPISEHNPWLKCLKDRVQPQPKQEWSEEDEYCRHQLIVFCENCMVQDDGAKRCAHWLKSLRPQKQWKPSEYQLKSLQEVIDAGHFTSYPNALETLYEQLKKLKC